jgi:putative addiction module component (TIGR02574 family)
MQGRFFVISSRIDLSALTPAERLSLIDELCESLSDEAALPMSPSLRRELYRRVEEAQESPEEGRAGEAIRSDLEGRGG